MEVDEIETARPPDESRHERCVTEACRRGQSMDNYALWRHNGATQIGREHMDVVPASCQLARLMPSDVARPACVGRERGRNVGNAKQLGGHRGLVIRAAAEPLNEFSTVGDYECISVPFSGCLAATYKPVALRSGRGDHE